MNPYLVFFSAWLVPGLGHLLQKRYVKGAIFFAGITLLVGLGMVMQGKFYEFPLAVQLDPLSVQVRTLHPLLLLGLIGDLGCGLLYIAGVLLHLDRGDITRLTFHYGTAYMACAGLINYLVALNAFDIARKKKKESAAAPR